MYIKTCKHCKKELTFENRFQFSAHNTNCDKNPAKILRKLKKLSKYEDHLVNCINCNTQFIVNCTKRDLKKKNHRLCCTRKCANTHINISEETKLKISNSINIKKSSCEIYYKTCLVCKKVFVSKHLNGGKKHCSKECTSKTLSALGIISGRKSAAKQSENRRSKNEIEFANLCIAKFQNVECNVPLFNGWDADVIIHDIKFAILWNGKWHYEKLTQKHSVKQVQNRDNIKINEIIKYGYTPYIIKDLGNDKNIVFKEFEKLLGITVLPR